MSQAQTETFYELLERCNNDNNNENRYDNINTINHNNHPYKAAWDFCSLNNNDDNDNNNNNNNNSDSGTGISFIDAVLEMHHKATTSLLSVQMTDSNNSSSCNSIKRNKHTLSTTTNSSTVGKLPIAIDISGNTGTGKTVTLCILAARFLYTTRCTSTNTTSTTDGTVSENLETTTTTTASQTVTTSTTSTNIQPQHSQPQVIFFDPKYNSSTIISTIVNILHGMFMEYYNKVQQVHDTTTNNETTITIIHLQQTIQNDIMNCLLRLHFVHVTQFMDYIPILETLRYELLLLSLNKNNNNTNTNTNDKNKNRFYNNIQPQPHPCNIPTLILWDDFLDEPILTSSSTTTPSTAVSISSSLHSNNNNNNQNNNNNVGVASDITAIRMDVIRQIELLLNECQTIFLITTSSTFTSSSNVKKQRIIGKKSCCDRFVTHTIHLEHDPTDRYSTLLSSTVSSSNLHHNNIMNPIESSSTSVKRFLATIKCNHNNNNNNNNNKQHKGVVDDDLDDHVIIPYSISYNYMNDTINIL